jgi:hypothetical protein
VKDEDIEGTRDEGSNDEDEKREAMLTSHESRYEKVDMMRERGSMIQVQVEQLLKGGGYKSTAAEHDLHHGAQADGIIHGDEHGMTGLLGDNAVKRANEDVLKTDDQTGNEDMLEEAYQRKNGASEEEDQKDSEEDNENDDEDEKQLNTQCSDMHNQLGMAQGHGALDNKTMECVDMIIKRNGFESTKEMKDEEYEADVKVHQGRELNMYEKPETRDGMLKTNLKGKYDGNVNVNNVMDGNNAAAPIEDLNLYDDNYYQYSTSEGWF